VTLLVVEVVNVCIDDLLVSTFTSNEEMMPLDDDIPESKLSNLAVVEVFKLEILRLIICYLCCVSGYKCS